MFEPFMLRALLAGIMITITAAPLGCFLLWRRMAFFSDALSHSALLGIALGFLIGMHIHWSIILICAVFATCFVLLERLKILSSDSTLNILSHTMLALGIIVASLLGNTQIDITAYLFGNILTTSYDEIIILAGSMVFTLLAITVLWRPLLLFTLHEDLARSEQLSNAFLHGAFTVLMTLVVAVSVHIVGILLITSLLITPAACARYYAKSPAGMAILSAIFGMIAVVIGLYSSFFYDIPSGPAIIVAAAICFTVTASISAIKSLI